METVQCLAFIRSHVSDQWLKQTLCIRPKFDIDLKDLLYETSTDPCFKIFSRLMNFISGRNARHYMPEILLAPVSFTGFPDDRVITSSCWYLSLGFCPTPTDVRVPDERT